MSRCGHKSVVNQYGLFLLAATLLGFALTVSLGRAQDVGTVKGRVTDQFDVAITNASISLYSPDRVLQVNSDQTGRFEFANIPSSTYKLEAWSSGFQARIIEGIRVPEKDAEPISIALRIANQPSDCGRGPLPTYEKKPSGQSALIGVVRDLSGSPLEGFKINIYQKGANRALASRRSDDKGEFQFRDMEPGQYVVRASHKRTWLAQSEIFWMTRENVTRITLNPLKRGSIIICQ